MTRRRPLPGSASATGHDQREPVEPLPAATGAPAPASAVAGSGCDGQEQPARILGELPAGTRWLTGAQVCEWLGVTGADWSAWCAAGTAPAHVIAADGQARVWVRHLERWLDTLEALPGGTGAAAPVGGEHGGYELAAVVPIDPARRRGGTRRIGGQA